MIPDPTYPFSTRVWCSQGKATYYLATLPVKTAKAIRAMRDGKKRLGWGSVRVELTVGKTTWRTSIFPHSAENSYLFLIKASVRKAENIAENTRIKVTLRLLD